MKTMTIANAKNQLSHLIHQLEQGEPVHLTRYGKPVAVMMSESEYQNLVQPKKSVYQAIQNWREAPVKSDMSLILDDDSGWDEKQLNTIRHENKGRLFSWDD